MNKTDLEYNRLLEIVLTQGRRKKNRTGVDTFGVFGEQAKFDLQEGFPLLTTKKVFFKGITHELLWFLSGSTNIKYLVDNNVNIWNDNAYANYLKWWQNTAMSIRNDGAFFGKDVGARSFAPLSKEEYLEKMRTSDVFAKTCGDLGEGTYGGMWRKFPVLGEQTDYGEQDRDNRFRGLSVDQIQKVMEKLKTNPDDRRLIVSAWHPYWVDHCALPPCHVMFQFHTEELEYEERCELFYKQRPNFSGHEFYPEILDEFEIPKRRLNCQLYQRSCDLFLGVPFNIASYALLTHMVAQSVNMLPGKFIHTFGDLHLYENHIEQAKVQLSRVPKDLPTLKLNPSVKDLLKFKFEDISVEGYDPHPAIKGEMAV